MYKIPLSMHTLKIKIYYEDTDAGGVVYYANYLRYLERARTELLAEKGINVAEYHNKGYLLAVVHVDIYYKKPARLGEIIEVKTEIIAITTVTLTLKQEIFRDDVALVEATVKLVCLNTEGKPQRLPSEFNSLSSTKHNSV